MVAVLILKPTILNNQQNQRQHRQRMRPKQQIPQSFSAPVSQLFKGKSNKGYRLINSRNTKER